MSRFSIIHPSDSLLEQTVDHVLRPDISVMGLGLSGMVNLAGFAQLGHDVIGVDFDQDQLHRLAQGHAGTDEPALQTALADGVATGRITTSDDLSYAVRKTSITCVTFGHEDMERLKSAIRAIGVGIAQKKSFHIIVLQGRLQPGLTQSVLVPLLENISGKRLGEDFGLAVQPVMRREGCAMHDFQNPGRIVVGCSDLRTGRVLKTLHASFDCKVSRTTLQNAEIVQVTDRLWQSTKQQLAEKISGICGPLGVETSQILEMLMQDQALDYTKG